MLDVLFVILCAEMLKMFYVISDFNAIQLWCC